MLKLVKKDSPQEATNVLVDTKEFLKGVTLLGKIIKTESPRNYGMVYHFVNDYIVATDGFRLARYPIPNARFTGFSLSKQSAKLLLGAIRTGFMALHSTLIVRDSNVAVTTRLAQLYVRTSNVKYPRYESVIPKFYNHAFSLNASELTPKVKALLAKSDKSNHISLKELFGHLQGVDDIIVNGKFLLDAIQPNKKCVVSYDHTDDQAPIRVMSDKLETIIVPITRK